MDYFSLQLNNPENVMAELSGNKKFMDYFGDKLDEEYSIEDFK